MNTRIRHLVALTATAVVVLSGCGSRQGDQPGTAADDSRPADGTYYLTAATDDGSDHPVEAGSQITMTIKGTQIGLHAGCNQMSGDGTWAGSKLTLEPLAMTEMACAEPLMAQDNWVAGLFEDPVAVALGDQGFTLTAGATVLEFEPLPEPDPAALLGTHWTLESITQAGGEDAIVSSVPQGVIATLLLKDGRAVITTGCNQGSAQAQREGSILYFDGLTTTLRPCDATSGPVEAAVLSVLGADGVTWAIAGDMLTLTAQNGAALTYLVDPSLDPEPVPSTIEGPRWRLTTISEIDGDSQSMGIVPDQVTATLQIAGDSGLLTTGCNVGGANVTVQGDRVHVESIRMTKMACRGPAGEIEKSILAVLRQGDLTWGVSDGELRLLSKDGTHELIYRAERSMK